MIIDSNPGQLDNFKEGIEKIIQGIRQVEEEQKKLLSVTVTIDEACKHYNCTKPTLLKRRKANLIPFVRFGNQFRYFIIPEKGLVCSK
jgi:excisionase family DNA binding protein